VINRLLRRRRGAPIAMLHEFHRPPYGGGNQFLLALRAELERRGSAVDVGHVGPETKAVLFNSHHADIAQLRKIRTPLVRMVHRVDGPIGAYRGREDGTDQKIWQLNHECADTTIFQSHYSLNRHLEMGLEFRDPHVIPNAADPSMFFAAPAHQPATPLRVIASSWSDNPRKGGPVYAWLDAHLDPQRIAFTFVGRIAQSLPHSRIIDAVPSPELADVLRQHDVYLTASEDDPCSNALVEALTCGLPAVFRKSGGHPELVRGGGYGFDQPEEIPELLERAGRNYRDLRTRVTPPTMAAAADAYLNVMGLS